MRITFSQLASDILDFLFANFAPYRNLSADSWSLIETSACKTPFWVRGIPKPCCGCFRLLAVQHASQVLNVVPTDLTDHCLN